MGITLQIIGFILLAICITLLAKGLHALSKNKKIQKVEFILGAISAILTVLAFAFPSNNNQDSKINIATNNEGNITIDGSFNSSIDNSVHQYYFEATNSMSVDAQLFKAEANFDSKSYEQVFEIYSSPELKNNPVANTNLGYLYAKGIYVEKNLEIAEQYYDKAINENFSSAFSNKLAMYLKNPEEYFDQTAELIIECYQNNINEVALFVSSFMSGSTDISVCRKDLENFCNTLSREEQKNLIQNLILVPAYYEIVKTSEVKTSSRFVTYKFISSKWEKISENSHYKLVYKYEKCSYKPMNVSLLNEDFIRLNIEKQ